MWFTLSFMVMVESFHKSTLYTLLITFLSVLGDNCLIPHHHLSHSPHITHSPHASVFPSTLLTSSYFSLTTYSRRTSHYKAPYIEKQATTRHTTRKHTTTTQYASHSITHTALAPPRSQSRAPTLAHSKPRTLIALATMQRTQPCNAPNQGSIRMKTNMFILVTNNTKWYIT